MNKNSKVFLALKIVAVSIAGILLALALSYYNFIVPEENISGVLLHTKAPDFTLQVYDGDGLNGETYSLEESKGKVVILNFWATTCNPCINELPYFNDLKEKYGDEVEIIAIHSITVLKQDPVQDFINGSPKRTEDWKTYDIIFAQDAEVVSYDEQMLTAFKAFHGKNAYPVTAMINADGVFAYVRQGSITYKILEDAYLKVKNSAN